MEALENEIRWFQDVADLQSKVIISILATSGLRIGTLAKLKYGHIKEELEAGKVPLCIHIKASETKGKYCDYFTFINEEAVNYLRLYLEQRKKGTEKIPPEEINEESPLIRNSRTKRAEPLESNAIYSRIHRLMFRIGLIKKNAKRYELNIHSFRKFFKTQLIARGVQPDIVDFMMGHKVSTYSDIKGLGVEKLREIYRKADLRIKSKPETSKLEQLKLIAESLGLDPEKVINEEALKPKRVVICPEESIKALQRAIAESLAKIVSRNKKV